MEELLLLVLLRPLYILCYQKLYDLNLLFLSLVTPSPLPLIVEWRNSPKCRTSCSSLLCLSSLSRDTTPFPRLLDPSTFSDVKSSMPILLSDRIRIRSNIRSVCVFLTVYDVRTFDNLPTCLSTDLVIYSRSLLPGVHPRSRLSF